MDTKGTIIVFGSLALFIAAIIAGAIIPGWGRGLLAAGIIGTMAWLVFAFWLARAMNSDI
jgi:hypothetical protein